jgi:hypothetical protein
MTVKDGRDEREAKASESLLAQEVLDQVGDQLRVVLLNEMVNLRLFDAESPQVGCHMFPVSIALLALSQIELRDKFLETL